VMCLAETLEGLARAAARAERESDATVVPHACIWNLSGHVGNQKRVGSVSARVVCADESIACALRVSGLERSERVCFGAFAARVRVGTDVLGAFVRFGGGSELSEYDSAKRRSRYARLAVPVSREFATDLLPRIRDG